MHVAVRTAHSRLRRKPQPSLYFELRPAMPPHSIASMLILPISRSWIVSRAAERVYMISAVLSLALSGTVLGTRIAQIVLHANRLPERTGTIVGIVLVPEVLGAAILWAGMLYFWFGFDESHWLARAFWFLCLCSILPLFWSLYYFVVYRRHSAERAEITSLVSLADS